VTLVSAQRDAAFLAAAAGLFAVLVSGELSRPVTVVVLIAFVAAYFVGERVAGQGVVAWNVGIVAALVWLGANVAIGASDIIVATSTFAVLLVIHRLFNRRGVRDYALLHLISLLMIAGGAALSAELAFGLAFLVFAVASTWSLTLTLLRAEIEEEARANQVSDGGASTLQSTRLVSPRLLGGLGGLALAALCVAALVFVLFPRVSFGLWQRRGAGGPRVGFSEQVQLGQVGRIKDDPRVAFRVRFPGAARVGDTLDTYWRGATFDTFDGHGWSDRAPSGRPLRQRRDGWYELGPRSERAVELDVELVSSPESTTLFTTGLAEAVRVLPRNVALRVVEGPRLLLDGQGDLTYAPAQAADLRYLLRAWLEGVPRVEEPGSKGEDPALFARHVALPALDPRIGKLAARLTADRPRPEAVRAIETYLREQMRYSLENAPAAADPLASFLFEAREGHCEYFATAMVVLLRSSGIPARLVTGFYGGRFVKRGEYFAVRQGDAHAWVEVHFPGAGWVTFDPTPASSRAAALETSYGRLQLWLDGLQTAWRSRVVDYDLMAQIQGVQGLLSVAKEAGERLQGASQLPRLQVAGRFLAGLALPAALVAALVFAWSRRRAPRPEQARSESQQRARALYLELDRRLAKRGVQRRPAQTPRELVAELHARGLPQAPLAARIVERYLSARFGTEPLGRDEYAALRRQLREI
jgi:transglutaminase-like putative cysteine protease